MEQNRQKYMEKWNKLKNVYRRKKYNGKIRRETGEENRIEK